MQNISQEKLLELLANEQELNRIYSSVRIIIQSELYAVIPEAFFTEQTAETFLYAARENKPEHQRIWWNKLLAWNAVLVFAFPEAVYAAIETFLPDTEPEHHIFAFVNDSVALDNTVSVHVNLREKRFDAVVQKDGILQLINTFETDTDEDAVFYILKIYEQLQLSPEHCVLYLHNTKRHIPLVYIVKKYIKNCISEN